MLMPTPLSVVCFKWRSPHGEKGDRYRFNAQTVNVFKRMVDRHYTDPHRVICVTDDADGIDPEVEVVPLWNDFAEVPSPHGGKNPSCYRRLKAFSPGIVDVLGPRFVMVDLDVVITRDVRPIWNRPEDIVLYGDTNPQPGSHYNGSMILQTAGSRSRVFEEFDPKTSPKKSLDAKCYGSDQGWISYCLGPGEKKWSREDGVYSFRNHLHMRGGRTLPENARIVIFHGEIKPWSQEAQELSWVKSGWR